MAAIYIESDDQRIEGWYIRPDGSDVEPSALSWNDSGNGPEVVGDILGPFETAEAAEEAAGKIEG